MLSPPPIPADIYDKVSSEMEKKGYDCECLGGGRISHQSQDRKIHVYGYSMVSPQLRAPVLAGEHPALLSHRTLPPAPTASRFPRGMTQETGGGWEPLLAPHGLCAVPALKAWLGLCPPTLRVLQRFEVTSTALELGHLPLPSPLYLQGHGAPRASSASGWGALPPGWLTLEATFPPAEWLGWLGE